MFDFSTLPPAPSKAGRKKTPAPQTPAQEVEAPAQDSETPAETTSFEATLVEAALVPLCAPDFFICTSPEMDALERAAADGKHDLNYADLEQELARIHQIYGATHFVRVAPLNSDLNASPEALRNLTGAQDADATFALLYIARLLAPPAPLPPNTTAMGWIDFDDVIKKIGWDPRSTAERREMRERLYQFLLFGERAQVFGTRPGKYVEKHTGKEIRTTIESAIWRILKVERPAGDSPLSPLQTPVRVEMVIDRDWAQLLTQPATAQYLPLGEVLGAIPGNKPSGAWARVIGLALASFWRRQPKAALDGSIKPTRRELLERYIPKTGPVAELLKSTNPQFAIDFWCAALQILVKAEFLAVEGEPQISAEQMRADLPRKAWAYEWLNAAVELKPGAAFGHTIVQRVTALPPAPSVAKPKRGRPRKKTT